MQDRQAALIRQRMQIERSQRELDGQEVALETRIDLLAEVDHALRQARLVADRERNRADLLEAQLQRIRRTMPVSSLKMLDRPNLPFQ